MGGMAINAGLAVIAEGPTLHRSGFGLVAAPIQGRKVVTRPHNRPAIDRSGDKKEDDRREAKSDQAAFFLDQSM